MFPPILFFRGFQHLKENTLETVSNKTKKSLDSGDWESEESNAPGATKVTERAKWPRFFLEVWFAMSQLEPAPPPKKLKGNMPLKSNSCLMVQLVSTDKWEHVLPSFGGWTYFWSPLQLGYDVRSPCLLYGSLDLRILQAWYMGQTKKNERTCWWKKSGDHHLGCFWDPANTGINYQPQLVISGFRPSTVWRAHFFQSTKSPLAAIVWGPPTGESSSVVELRLRSGISFSACGVG